jgi:hypothetical protein
MSDIFNPHWVAAHRDQEMSYIIQSTISGLPQKYSYRLFAETMAEAFTSTLHEREPASAALFNANDLYDIFTSVFSTKGKNDWFWSTNHEDAAHTLVFAWLTYVHSLLLGAPSPRTTYDDYNPFANEGGFCNPRKLKMLDDA